MDVDRTVEVPAADGGKRKKVVAVRSQYYGFNKIALCSPDYMRELLRYMFEIRAKWQPYVAPHYKPAPEESGIIHEGCQFDSWMSAPFEEDEKVGFVRKHDDYTEILVLTLKDIVDIQISDYPQPNE